MASSEDPTSKEASPQPDSTRRRALRTRTPIQISPYQHYNSVKSESLSSSSSSSASSSSSSSNNGTKNNNHSLLRISLAKRALLAEVNDDKNDAEITGLKLPQSMDLTGDFDIEDDDAFYAAYSATARNRQSAIPFSEPPAARSVSVTGQPLEDPPTMKLKRETFSGKKKKSTNNNNYKTSDSNDETQQLEQLESDYRSKLITGESEKLTQSSLIRSVFKPVEKTRAGVTATKKSPEAQPPTTPTKKRPSIATQEDTISKKNKRVKQSPHKTMTNYLGFDIPNPKRESSASSNITPLDDQPDTTIHNQDYCSSCGLTGMFLCCESCPKSFHFYCLNPPIDEETELPDQWFCNECLSKTLKKSSTPTPGPTSTIANNSFSIPSSLTTKKSKSSHMGIFTKLFDALRFKNPTAFKLPREITDAFSGVSMSKDGDYQDDDMKPTKSYKQLQAEAEDPLFEVYDKEGNPYFCHICGGSGLGNKLMTKCDYCALVYHLDCLGLAHSKKLGSKWKCPNHADWCVKPKRKLRNQGVVEVELTRGFVCNKEDNVDVVLIDEEEEEVIGVKSKSSSVPAVSQPNQSESQQKIKKEEVEDSESSFIVDENELEEKLPIDPVHQYKVTDSGLSYTKSKELVKGESSQASGYVTYKLKEESIILDFITGTKIKKLNEVQKIDEENMRAYNSEINVDSSHKQQRRKPGLKDYLLSISKLSNRAIVSPIQKQLNLKELLKVVDDEYRIEEEVLSKDELSELMIVKKLMELKGGEELIRFLKS